MDIGVSVALLGLLKVALWLGLVAFAVWLGRAIYAALDPVLAEPAEGEVAVEQSDPDLGDVLWEFRYWLAGWVMALFAVIFFTQIEMAYRPKSVVQPPNPVLEQQLRELDRAGAPQIGPAEGDVRDDANAGYSERNAAEAEVAK